MTEASKRECRLQPRCVHPRHDAGEDCERTKEMLPTFTNVVRHGVTFRVCPSSALGRLGRNALTSVAPSAAVREPVHIAKGYVTTKHANMVSASVSTAIVRLPRSCGSGIYEAIKPVPTINAAAAVTLTVSDRSNLVRNNWKV